VFCEKCGATVSDGARFCAACGHPRNQEAVLTTPPTAQSGRAFVPDNIRRTVLAKAVQIEVLAGGRVETQGEFNAALRFGGKPVNHILHLLLSLVTLGLWVLVWIAMAISSAMSKYTVTLTVDEYGDLLHETCIKRQITNEVYEYVA